MILGMALLIIPFSAQALTVDVGTGVNAVVGSSTSGGASVTGDVKANVNVQSSDDQDAMVQIQVGSDTSSSAGVEITGDPDFDMYAESVSSTHANVSGVEVGTEGEVEVAYKHRGWLFGFIPVTVTSHTTVEAPQNGTGTVEATVALPWWSFLVSGVSSIKASTETELVTNAEVKSEASLGARAEASAAARVKLAEAIIASISKIDANVRASYDLKAATK